jgi:hypothetical protein
MIRRQWYARGAVLAFALLLTVIAACSSNDNDSKVPDGSLVGLFRLDPGTFADGKLDGTWFRMLQPGGKADSGPYMINADSPADGGLATLLTPGRSGGLWSGSYQSQPVPAFDGNGGSLSNAIITPTKFFAVDFGISTNRIDPQTKTLLPPPTVTLSGGKLSADLSSWAASWNRQDFNQGAPKPVSSTGAQAAGQNGAGKAWDYVAGKWLDTPAAPVSTGARAAGTFDAKTRRFVLDWTSLIVGGPFNGFTGIWHLTGIFEPRQAGPGQSGSAATSTR